MKPAVHKERPTGRSRAGDLRSDPPGDPERVIYAGKKFPTSRTGKTERDARSEPCCRYRVDGNPGCHGTSDYHNQVENHRSKTYYGKGLRVLVQPFFGIRQYCTNARTLWLIHSPIGNDLTYASIHGPIGNYSTNAGAHWLIRNYCTNAGASWRIRTIA
jgi:hypothetical protein